jgi:hypothetical protein
MHFTLKFNRNSATIYKCDDDDDDDDDDNDVVWY